MTDKEENTKLRLQGNLQPLITQTPGNIKKLLLK